MIDSQLQQVWELRRLEKIEMARLKTASEANEKFLEDGDVEALRNTLASIGLYNGGF